MKWDLDKLESRLTNATEKLKECEEELKKTTKKVYYKDESDESIHSLKDIFGEDAGYIHTARSRNDQVVTDFKIWVKDSSKNIKKILDTLIRSILKKAEKNINTVMPGFTHLKNAQPVSFAHYLLAYVEC